MTSLVLLSIVLLVVILPVGSGGDGCYFLLSVKRIILLWNGSITYSSDKVNMWHVDSDWHGNGVSAAVSWLSNCSDWSDVSDSCDGAASDPASDPSAVSTAVRSAGSVSAAAIHVSDQPCSKSVHIRATILQYCHNIIISTNNKKFELMFTRCVKAYSSSCSQIALVYLEPFRLNSLLKCVTQPKIAKKNKTPYFGSSASFKVIDVDKTKKLVTSACCDRQHAQCPCLSATVFMLDWPTAVK